MKRSEGPVTSESSTARRTAEQCDRRVAYQARRGELVAGFLARTTPRAPSNVRKLDPAGPNLSDGQLREPSSDLDRG